jgi:trans-aconitate methyltransferase
MAHEFDGKKYETASAHQKEWGAKLIAELALQGNERALDLGCGDGTLTLKLAELLPRGEVVGIDASKGMIDTARQKERDNLRFLLMDINHLDFTDRFDIVFSNATLHWIKDHDRLLKNVHRALAAGGRLRFSFAADGNCSHFNKVVREAMALEDFATSFDEFEWPWYMSSADEYLTLVESSGLPDARVWGENADRYFANDAAMIQWIDQPSLVPFLAFMPEAHKAAFREYVVSEMIRETKQADGTCFETFRRINLMAGKSSGGGRHE